MTRYALQPRYRRYVRGYGFMSFAKNLANRGLVSTMVRAAADRGKNLAKSALDKGKSLGKKVIKAAKDLSKLKTIRKAVDRNVKKVVAKSADVAGDFVSKKYQILDQDIENQKKRKKKKKFQAMLEEKLAREKYWQKKWKINQKDIFHQN